MNQQIEEELLAENEEGIKVEDDKESEPKLESEFNTAG